MTEIKEETVTYLMQPIKTDRLILRELNLKDASFILNLVNQPSWKKYIGDKNVNNLQDARDYLNDSILKMYQEHGHGLLAVELTDSDKPIGICGLLKRETLDDVDLGFAFLSEYCSKGYARESSLAIIEDTRKNRKHKRILAITLENNYPSIKLLESVGFQYIDKIKMDHSKQELQLYAIELKS